ncbi:NAD(P)H-hydrate dehydratase [Lutimonas halocynthiae]|uniref:NAD(P)H-hydrate dehydratase n=1 Tax=Lutimonas halocynthiae TaxID=1446477 RepID=UPI0025B52BB1|nr:NAD(P)H-hydrate dehydratase [Lutimonas halocynthiae]MDN3643646.1 NAD(P)H-hydrate dehydratase [Lutimonas halocynthiae]
MKILSAKQVYKADQATMKNLSISSTDLMEKAGLACFNWIYQAFQHAKRPIHVFCGMGNNGGDGLVIARLLAEKALDVKTYLVNFSDKRTDDFRINLERLKKLNSDVYEINAEGDFPKISNKHIVVDAIFGIGLKRAIDGFTRQLVMCLNASKATIISIDIPSGLFANQHMIDNDAIVKADQVLTFQVPKLALLIPENQNFISEWIVLDIELDKTYLETVDVKYEFITTNDIKRIYKKRKRFSHKGSHGHSLIIGGSFGKIGAVILASRAAIKSGSGLVSSYIPKCGYTAMQVSVPEVMVEVDDEKIVQFFNFKTKPSAIGIGPGLGTHLKTKKGFVDFYSNCKIPMVIDADGLNIISEFKDLKKLIPKNTILTPHPKEFERLAGKWTDDYHKLEMLKKFSVKYKCVVVLKGAYTAVAYQGKIWFNSSGNAALATAGSGDVLTGIICSLLAQGYTSIEAALMGVYIHGRTADIGIESEESMESFIASDIIANLAKVFKELA